jgi:hypothetical protein
VAYITNAIHLHSCPATHVMLPASSCGNHARLSFVIAAHNSRAAHGNLEWQSCLAGCHGDHRERFRLSAAQIGYRKCMIVGQLQLCVFRTVTSRDNMVKRAAAAWGVPRVQEKDCKDRGLERGYNLGGVCASMHDQQNPRSAKRDARRVRCACV